MYTSYRSDRYIIIGDVSKCERIGCSDECERCVCYAKGGVLVVGCLSGGKLYIPVIVSSRRGGMKMALNELVKLLGTNRLVFTTVVSKDLVDALMKRRDMIKKVSVLSGELAIEVEWDVSA